ncbi:MAG: L,D-transpeptidase [Pseudomonadota bacterium]
MTAGKQARAGRALWFTNGLKGLALAAMAAATLAFMAPDPAVALPTAKQNYRTAQPAAPSVRRAVRPQQRVQQPSRTQRAVRTAPRPSAVAGTFQRQTVSYSGKEAPGTIIIDTSARHLFLVRPGGKAIRYGVGVGRAGFGWSGSAKIGRKAQWPRWTPPASMIRRQPELAKWAGGMPGGVDNPLGARALYLYRGGRDTLYRIHGTNEPWSIGRAMSSGCIRMLNDDVTHLYGLAKVGAKVVVR